MFQPPSQIRIFHQLPVAVGVGIGVGVVVVAPALGESGPPLDDSPPYRKVLNLRATLSRPWRHKQVVSWLEPHPVRLPKVGVHHREAFKGEVAVR